MTSGMSRALGTEEVCEDFAEKILTNQAEFNDYPEMKICYRRVSGFV